MPALVARVFRGDREESVHYGSVAVVNKKGELTHFVGDPDFFTFVRSSAKPFQVLPIVLTGAADHFGFSPKQLSIMCGSHAGTDHHREVVLANLEKIDVSPDRLKCGTHLPLFMQMNGGYPKRDEHLDPLRHNCSGKHSGFLALTKFLGRNIEEYLEVRSEAQSMVLETAAKMYGVDKNQVLIGIDGCSAPNFGLPLRYTATAFCKLANGDGGTPEVSAGLKRVKAAMTEFPEMFSGEGRFDLALMRTFPGNIICKGGAEAIQGIGFAEPTLGIAVKIEDGNPRALYTVCIEILKQLGLLKIEQAPQLQPFYNPEIRNYRNILTGRIVADFTLVKTPASSR